MSAGRLVRITKASEFSSTGPHSTSFGLAASFTHARAHGKTSDPPPARRTLMMTASRCIRALAAVILSQPSTLNYQLAVVVDDATMRITEVVRGADLLKSTARQLLLYWALELVPPEFFHCPLMTDDAGTRLAKRHDVLSLRTLRARRAKPEPLRAEWTAAHLRT